MRDQKQQVSVENWQLRKEFFETIDRREVRICQFSYLFNEIKAFHIKWTQPYKSLQFEIGVLKFINNLAPQLKEHNQQPVHSSVASSSTSSSSSWILSFPFQCCPESEQSESKTEICVSNWNKTSKQVR